MSDEKTTKVTFTANVDHYVRGDVEELTSDELKRVDEYAKRWNIENPYKKGDAKLEADENASGLPSRTTTVTSADGERVTPKAASDAIVDEPAEVNQDEPSNTESDDAPSDDAGNQPANELPPATNKPVTGQGKTPKAATK